MEQTDLRTHRTPARLAFADHVHGLVAGDRAPSSPEGAKMLTRADQALDRPVILFRAAQITALIITLVAAASAYPVLVSGQRAYKAIRGMSDDTGAEWLDEHMDRAEKTIGAFYFLAFLALAGLFVPFKWPKAGWPLAATTLAVAVICSGIAVYIAQPAPCWLAAKRCTTFRQDTRSLGGVRTLRSGIEKRLLNEAEMRSL